MIHKFNATLILCCCLLLLGACTHKEMKESKNWVSDKLGLSSPEEKAVSEPQREVWCYRTIGKPDCYDEPQPDAEGRLIGVIPNTKLPSTPEGYRKGLADTATGSKATQ